MAGGARARARRACVDGSVGARTAVGGAHCRCSMEDGVVDAATRKRKLERWRTECRRFDAAGLPKPPRPFPFYGRVGKKKSHKDGDLVHPQACAVPLV